MMLKLFNVVLLILVVMSAFGVIYAKHENRKLYVQFRESQKQRDALDVDWGRLQLEQSTWATHSRIEEVARKKLAMRNVEFGAAVIIKP